MSKLAIRNFVRGEEDVLLGILAGAFGPLLGPAQPRKEMNSRQFDPKACLIAEEDGSPIGCVALTGLPRQDWYVVRYLAVTRPASRKRVAAKLLEKALACAKSKQAEYVRATTPAIQPYVDVYKQLGLQPVRRDFRITWTMAELPPVPSMRIHLRPVTEETIEQAARLFVSSLTSHWDWRTKEQGGPDAVERSFIEGVKNGEQWMLGESDGRTVGSVGIIPDFYGLGEARFRGAYVLPEHRGHGLGMALMSEICRLAVEKGQRKMTVYTFSYLDCLAPGALLYLRSGGKIDAEYLQLERSG